MIARFCRIFLISLALLPAVLAVSASAAEGTPFRPSAAPLVTYDPSFRIWSAADLVGTGLRPPKEKFGEGRISAVDVIDPGANPGKKAGFQARPAVGGVLVKMLAGPAFWAKWSAAAGMRPAE